MPKDKSSFDREESIILKIKKSDMKKILSGNYNLTVHINKEKHTPNTVNTDNPNVIKIQNIKLTKRELEVLKNMAEGKTNVEIAKDLTVSKYTIKSHVTNILQKLMVDDRLKAVVKAMQENII